MAERVLGEGRGGVVEEEEPMASRGHEDKKPYIIKACGSSFVGTIPSFTRLPYREI